MKQVAVKLSSPWPTAVGLRRPQEGPITVSEAEAKRIEEAGCGEILGGDDAEDKPKGKGKGKGPTKAEVAAAAKAEAEAAAAAEAAANT